MKLLLTILANFVLLRFFLDGLRLLLDFLGEPDQFELVFEDTFVAGEVHVLARHLEVCVPLVDEVKCLDCFDIEPLAGLEDIIDHDLVLVLKVLQVAAGRNNPLEREDRHAVLVLFSREVILELKVEHSLLLELTEVKWPLLLRCLPEKLVNRLHHLLSPLVEGPNRLRLLALF